jgi:hypothetical protein
MTQNKIIEVYNDLGKKIELEIIDVVKIKSMSMYCWP